MNGSRWIIKIAFVVAYAALLSLGLLCLLQLSSIVLATAMFSEPVYKDYPRFTAFCYCVGLFALGGLVLLFVLDGKMVERFSFVRRICWSKFGVIIGLAVPFILLWNELFRYLQRIL